MKYVNLIEHSDDWLKYAIAYQLNHQPKENIIDLRDQACADPRIKKYLSDVYHFHDQLVTNHKNPDLPIHKLLFLLDLGLDRDIPEINHAIEEILIHQDEHGLYQSMTNVPKHFGGTGTDVFSWCLCDAPLLLMALIRAGVDYEKHIKRGVDYLVSLYRDNGFPCAVSKELGKFRGPGRIGDCCPYATLIMTHLLSYIPEYQNSELAKSSVNNLLNLWENSLTDHPYMFYMGHDFRKLKAPSNWYDILSVAEVISKFEFARSEPLFLEMIQLIKNKQQEDGFFIPESIYLKLKDWDFGQKKERSPYLTFLCYRLFERLT